MTHEVRGRTLRALAAALVAGALAPGLAAAQAPGGGYAVGEKVAPAPVQPPLPPGVRELKWDDLVPKDWNPRRLFDQLGLNAMRDNDPRADELLARIRAEWDRAPVVKELDGARVRLPGFVVMLEGTPKGITEFLLVPYFGACIHVPPPPANQLVHVFPQQPVPDGLSMQAVWVVGTLSATSAGTKLGSAGYRISSAHVDKYERR
jgi:hypothetical protein